MRQLLAQSIWGGLADFCCLHWGMRSILRKALSKQPSPHVRCCLCSRNRRRASPPRSGLPASEVITEAAEKSNPRVRCRTRPYSAFDASGSATCADKGFCAGVQAKPEAVRDSGDTLRIPKPHLHNPYNRQPLPAAAVLRLSLCYRHRVAVIWLLVLSAVDSPAMPYAFPTTDNGNASSACRNEGSA